MTVARRPRKLIEVALPLDDINAAAAREKSIRHGHPSTLHLWWARRPLAAARAVIFAQMVNDPGFENGNGFQRGVNKKEAEKKREELFQIIRDLVKWENTNNEEVLKRARDAIWESWRETCQLNKEHPQADELFNPEKLPAFHDPFAGGGALPLEAQRLGLEAYASDLNPVAVTINKAMIEIPPRFAGRKPVGPIPEGEKETKLIEDWSGAKGLAEDVRRYGAWMRAEAENRIGHLYPKIEITEELAKDRPDLKPMVGQKLTVIAWLWARTVKSPNPVYSHVDVPLASTFILSSKAGKEAYVDPVIEGDTYHFVVRIGKASEKAKNGTKLARGANFECLFSKTSIDPKYIKSEGTAGRMGQKLMAIVAEGKSGRVYLSPVSYHETTARIAEPNWRPETNLPDDPRNFWTLSYGLMKFGDLFTDRQLVALNTFSDLVSEAIEKCQQNALCSGYSNDISPLEQGGSGALAYAQALGVYLAAALGKTADYNSAICSWISGGQTMRNTFGRQAIPMAWDFAEANTIGESTGSFESGVSQVVRVINELPAITGGSVYQHDAQTQKISSSKVISTDPPYYDNIGYADLSDFFYIWIRRSLRGVYPKTLSTLAVPKSEELVATPYRHGSKDAAEGFFLSGMRQAMCNLAECSHPAFPVTIYYAFKQSETSDKTGTSSTGWETFLQAVIESGFSINGTWPMRTEMGNRMISSGTNALASSIVLVCTQRSSNATTVGRREFVRELNSVLPEALMDMTKGGDHAPVAPVDLAQSAIGPGIAVFSKYEAVLNQDGSKMSVHDALILINKAISDFLNPDGSGFDADTLFCSAWFDQNGWNTGSFGDANTLAQAKGTTVDGVKHAGVIESGGGKVRLLKWAEYPSNWDPTQDERTPVWEACHHMIRRLNQQGETEAGALLARMPDKGEAIRQLAYHLYTLCERKKWAEDARAYNELIGAWNAIVAASFDVGHKGSQTELELDFGGK